MQPECWYNKSDFCRRSRKALTATLLLLSAAGCPTPPPPLAPKPFERVTLHVLAPDTPTVRALLLRHGNSWSEISGARVEFASDGDQDADLILFPPAELPKLATAARLAPLPDSLRDEKASFDFNALLRPYRTHLMGCDNRSYALPVLGDGFVYVYRADLFDMPSHPPSINKRLPHPLGANGPATWQEVEIIASYFPATPVCRVCDAATCQRPSLP